LPPRRWAWSIASLCLLASAVFLRPSGPEGVDLLRSQRATLGEARAAGEPAAEDAIGRPRRIRNVVREALPAAPPSRYRFAVDVPRKGRLELAAGIPGRHQEGSAVEFVVSVRDGGRDKTVLSQLVDPANRTEHRQWVPLHADLSPHGGHKVEIVLETRGFDEGGPADRAFWGNPTITVRQQTAQPLVVLYLVDTLRADHLPLYGYARDTAPELTRLARDAVVFDRAIASSSWTKPSVASLFTSLRPREHGCVQFYTPLSLDLVTLAERLQDRGYATGAVVANTLVLGKDMHFDQGFSYFAAPAAPHRAADVVDAGLAFLDARAGQPALLYLHTMDAHTPYAPPPPFDAMFGPERGGRPAAEPSDYRSPGDLARIVGQYDGAVAYGDRELGRFLDGLRARGLYDQALVVFLADHGEELLDHGGWVHGHQLYDELVRVPLVVKYPGGRGAGRRVASLVELVDVLPTVLKSQGLSPAAGIAGRPLEPDLDQGRQDRVALFETKYREHVAYGARSRDAKYVRHVYPERAERAFDLGQDPGERRARSARSVPGGEALKQAAESAVSPGAFRHRLRVAGGGSYELHVRSAGWLEVLARVGLGEAERVDRSAGGQTLRLLLRPDQGRPREIEFLVRPHGAPVWIDGKHGSRRLAPRDIALGGAAAAAVRVPFLVPDVESLDGLFVPPASPSSGVSLWLVPSRGHRPRAEALTAEERGDLEALGYLGGPE
jgi:arylsulfatase A-like enzyme